MLFEYLGLFGLTAVAGAASTAGPGFRSDLPPQKVYSEKQPILTAILNPNVD